MKEGIQKQVDHGLHGNLDIVNHETVKAALHLAALQNLKPGKIDALIDFNSDCFINASDELIQ